MSRASMVGAREQTYPSMPIRKSYYLVPIRCFAAIEWRSGSIPLATPPRYYRCLPYSVGVYSLQELSHVFPHRPCNLKTCLGGGTNARNGSLSEILSTCFILSRPPNFQERLRPKYRCCTPANFPYSPHVSYTTTYQIHPFCFLFAWLQVEYR